MHGFCRVSYINIILIMHSILCYKMIAKNKKKMQKLDQFKLLNLFSYQIILPDCVPEVLLSQPLSLITFILKEQLK